MKLRHLLLGRKAMTNLNSVLKCTKKQRHHFVDKDPYKAMVFPVVVCRWESWTIKKVECWRIDVFKLLCWIKLIRVPWTEWRSSQWILKEINPEYSLEGLMLKLQNFGHLMQSWLLGKDPDVVKDWGQDEKGTTEDEMAGCHHWLNGHEFEQIPGDSGQGILVCCSPWDDGKSWTQLSDWTTIKIWKIFYENLEGTSNVQKKISDLTIWKVYFINIIIYLYKHITFT